MCNIALTKGVQGDFVPTTNQSSSCVSFCTKAWLTLRDLNVEIGCHLTHVLLKTTEVVRCEQADYADALSSHAGEHHSVWNHSFANPTVQLRNKLSQIHECAIMIVGQQDYEPLQTVSEGSPHKIITDPQNPLFSQHQEKGFTYLTVYRTV